MPADARSLLADRVGQLVIADGRCGPAARDRLPG
jgi:hypothetical protein